MINSYIDSQMPNSEDKNEGSLGNQPRYFDSKFSNPDKAMKSAMKNSKG
jgi:hypothetical protein